MQHSWPLILKRLVSSITTNKKHVPLKNYRPPKDRRPQSKLQTGLSRTKKKKKRRVGIRSLINNSGGGPAGRNPCDPLPPTTSVHPREHPAKPHSGPRRTSRARIHWISLDLGPPEHPLEGGIGPEPRPLPAPTMPLRNASASCCRSQWGGSRLIFRLRILLHPPASTTSTLWAGYWTGVLWTCPLAV